MRGLLPSHGRRAGRRGQAGFHLWQPQLRRLSAASASSSHHAAHARLDRPLVVPQRHVHACPYRHPKRVACRCCFRTQGGRGGLSELPAPGHRRAPLLHRRELARLHLAPPPGRTVEWRPRRQLRVLSPPAPMQRRAAAKQVQVQALRGRVGGSLAAGQQVSPEIRPGPGHHSLTLNLVVESANKVPPLPRC